MDTKINVPSFVAKNPSVFTKINRSKRLWDGLLWTSFAVAILFVLGYVIGVLFLINGIQNSYPKFAARIGAFIHIIPSMLILILSPLQLSDQIRQQYTKWHRYAGLSLVILTPISVAGSLLICITGPEGGKVVSVSGFYVSIYWLVILFIGYKRILDKDIASHREWMIRYFWLSYAIVIMRVFVIFFSYALGWEIHESVGVAIPSTWILTIILMEYYIIYTRVPFQALNTSLVVDNNQVLVTYSENFTSIELASIEKVCWNTSIFTFRLPHPTMKFNVPPGHHIFLRAKINGKTVIRPYTPIYRGKPGVVEFVIKRYETGLLSKYIHDNLVVGNSIDCKGPVGAYKYLPNQFDTINMIAGGSGITPIMSVLRAVVDNPCDHTSINLLYFSNTEADIILRSDLDDIHRMNPERFKLTYVVTKPAQSWTSETGRINEDMARKYLPKNDGDNSQVIICGPLPMALKSIDVARKLGHQHYNIHAFGITDH